MQFFLLSPRGDTKYKVMFCKVRFFVYPGIYPGIVSSVQHYTLPDRFCDFCTTFIPLPDNSVISITTSYRYPGMAYTFHTRNRGSSVTSVKHHTLPGGGL